MNRCRPSSALRALFIAVLGAMLLAACATPPAAPPAAAPGSAGASSASAPASAAPPPSRQFVRMAGTAITYAQIAIPVAIEAGLFEKNGLDVEMTFGPRAHAALIAGEVQMATGSTEDALIATLSGADLAIVGVMVPYLQHNLVVRPEIRSMEDVRGKSVGVTKRNGLPHTVVRMAAKRAGVDPERDFTIVEMNDTAGQMAGLVSGAIVATALVPPYTEIALREGMQVLYDFQRERLEYAIVGLAVNRDWAARNENAVLGILRALAEAQHMTHTRPDFVSDVYVKWAKTGEDSGPPAVALAREIIPIKMTPTEQGIQRVLDAIVEVAPAAAAAPPSRFIDDRYIQRLEQEGFYRGLGVD